MGLMDLFRRYFPAYNNEKLGPNDLPSDVVNDFRNNSRNNLSHLNEITDEVLPSHSYGESPHNIDKEFQNVFREMDSIFQSFFSSIPSLGFHQGAPPQSDLNANQSLRDKMLDGVEDQDNSSSVIMPFQEEHHPQGFAFKFHVPMFRDFWQSSSDRQMNSGYSMNDEDRDLDADFESGKRSIDEILHPGNSQPMQDQSTGGFHNLFPQEFSSAFKYSTVTKKINSDGSVETTTKKRDSDGNEQVVVSRTLGEQTHSLITKKKQSGEEETTESFINMDENELEKFDEKWSDSNKDTPRDQMVSPGSGNIFPIDLSEAFSWWKPKL